MIPPILLYVNVLLISKDLASDDAGVIQWIVEPGTEDDTVTIKNMASETYLSFDFEPSRMKPVELYPQPREWSLIPTDEEPGTY